MGGDGVVEVGQQIRIGFPSTAPIFTRETYNEIVEEERICWTVNAYEILGIIIPSPSFVLRSARCVELFDDKLGGTMIHNWISYAGIGWPSVVAFTGLIVENCFNNFNAELAVEFV